MRIFILLSLLFATSLAQTVVDDLQETLAGIASSLQEAQFMAANVELCPSNMHLLVDDLKNKKCPWPHPELRSFKVELDTVDKCLEQCEQDATCQFISADDRWCIGCKVVPSQDAEGWLTYRQPENYADCESIFVGAGSGGVYSAWRAVDSGEFDPSKMCIFEYHDRIGGRAMAAEGYGPEENMFANVGAYRYYSRSPMEAHVIEVLLGFKAECYEPTNNCPLNDVANGNYRNLIDETTGHRASFNKWQQRLLDMATAAGARVYLSRELLSVVDNNDGTMDMAFLNRETNFHFTVHAATHAFLNLPPQPLRKVLYHDATNFAMGQGWDSVFEMLHSTESVNAMKVYLWYDRAWWYEMGKRSGSFSLDHVESGTRYGLDEDQKLPEPNGRWHDGDVHCGDNGECHGFLLAIYDDTMSFGDDGMTYGQLRNFQVIRKYIGDDSKPMHVMDMSKAQENAYVMLLHEQILKVLAATEEDHEAMAQWVAANGEIPSPTGGVAGIWRSTTSGIGVGWGLSNEIDHEHGRIWQSSRPELTTQVLKPFEGLNLHIMNEAYSDKKSWSEGSLLMAERIFMEHYGQDMAGFLDGCELQGMETENPGQIRCPDYDGLDNIQENGANHLQGGESNTEVGGRLL